MSSPDTPNNASGAFPLISRVDGKFLLDCDEIEYLEEYVLAGIRLPYSDFTFEATYPRKEIDGYLSQHGQPKLYDAIKSATIAVSTSCQEFQRDTLVLIRDFGGEISVFAQEAQRSLAEIISGLETQARSGRKDASAFKERARKLLDRNQESYKRKMEKYVDFQRETTKFTEKILQDQKRLIEAITDLTQAVEKKTQGGNVFKTLSLGVMLAALAVGNIIALGNLQEATENKYREFQESRKGAEDSHQEIDAIRSLAEPDPREGLQKALKKLTLVLNEFQSVGADLNVLGERIQHGVGQDEVILRELRQKVEGWRKVQLAGERFQEK